MKLTTLLKKKNLRQEDLAEKLGTTQASVSRWIAEIHFPSAAVAQRIGHVLRVEVDWSEYAKGRLEFKGCK